jgi:8-oxo-dGTP pyrophosphatase MutT (NUDIX family)
MTAVLIQQLTDRLRTPLPGSATQRTMEPELSYGRHVGPARYDARQAAVAVALYQTGGAWQIPLVVRPESLTHHAGQIGLPGGIIDPGETSEQAALRELEEELGIDRSQTTLLGQLTPLYVFGTNFLITPWIMSLSSPVSFHPSAAEVQEVLQVPLTHLLDPKNRGQHIEKRGTLQLTAPHFHWQGHNIWGATGMILAEFVAIIHDLPAALTAA